MPFMPPNQQHQSTQFNGPLSGTTQVSRYQKGKTNLDFIGARDSEWQWQQLGHMQICTSLETNNHASTPQLSFFTGRMPFMPPNQQRQSTEGTSKALKLCHTLPNKFLKSVSCLQCFDAVGWAAGRASGL